MATQVAQTILQQLGGRRFIVMTGAKNFTGGEQTLSFKVPSNTTKGRISHVRITLNACDLYDVEYLSIRGTTIKTVSTDEGIYCDRLQAAFTETTGLHTHL